MKSWSHKFLLQIGGAVLAVLVLAASAMPAAAQNLTGETEGNGSSLVQPFAPGVPSTGVPSTGVPSTGNPSSGAPGGEGLPGVAPPAYKPVVLTTMPAPIVVELFTSEGCSSCPPADALLGELAQRQYVLPLSYHVDYWDYIGWKDRFGDPKFTRRQYAYAEAQGKSMVYTPQMIVAGAIDVVGSDRKEVEKALKTAYTRNAMYRVQILREDDGKVVAQFPEAPIGVPATIWLVTYQKTADSHVNAGENSGRHLQTYNVVRSLQKVGMWTGAATEIELDLDAAAKAASPEACAIIANQAEHGPIVAAAGFKFENAW